MDKSLGLLAAIALLACSAAWSLDLVRDGKPAAVIVTGTGAASEPASLAVADLQRVLERMSGAQLDLSPSPPPSPGGRGCIAVGLDTDFPGVLDKPLGKHEVAIVTRGNALYILGGGPASTSDAVYTFLERLGCRWYMPGEIGEVVPSRATVTWGEPDLRQTPAFLMRQPWYAWGVDGVHTSQAGGRRWDDWLRRNRCGGERVWHGHNLLAPIPPDKYFKDHPEYYALVRGERRPTQPCTSNPDLVPIFVEAICRNLEEYGHNSYSLCPEDNDQFCECANCRALDSGVRDPGFGGKIVVTDRLVKFFNQVAAGVRQKHPEAIVTFYGYLNHTLPPTTVKLGPGVAMVFTAQQFCTVHGVSDPQCASRQKMKRILAEYGRQTPHLYIYEYDPAPGSAGLPQPLYLTHARDLRVYRDLGVRGFSIESHKAWASTFPNHWFWAKGMWNPDFDEREALAGMCRDMYGPAATPMLRYYTLLAGAVEDSGSHPNWGLNRYAQVWKPETVKGLGQALQEAERAAREADSQVRERVLYARLEYSYLTAYLDFAHFQQAGEVSRAIRAGERMVSLLNRQRDLNEDLCLYVECISNMERQVLALKHEWANSAEFGRTNDVLCRLPVTWAFREDPKDRGLAEGWQAEDLSLAGWGKIRTDSQWCRQKGHEELNGTAWARTTFRLPARIIGQRVMLHVGALDEKGTIWINGQQVAERGDGLPDNAWMAPFEVDVSQAVRPGGNTLAVRAVAERGLGGIWRRALLYIPGRKGGVR